MNVLNKLKPCLALLLSVTFLFGSMPLEVAFVLAQDQGVFEVKLTDDEAEIDADLQEEGTTLDLDNGDADYDFIYPRYEYDKYHDREMGDREDHVTEVDGHQEDIDIKLSLDIVVSGSFPGENGAQWTLDADGVVQVGSGSISSSGIPTQSPWHAYRDSIREIIFTEEVEATSDLSNLFRDLSHVTLLEGLEQIDTRNVTNMNSMFRGLSRLTTLNLSSLDTGNVTSMYSMFRGSSDLETLDLFSFDTKNVETMSSMFYGASSLTTLNLSSFDTRNVTSMYSMFRDTSDLTLLEGLEQFDTSSVVNMQAMFFNANSLTYIEGLEQIDTRKVTNMSHMFRGASSLTTLNLSGIDTSRVTDMTSMFRNASSLTTIEGLEYVDTSNVTNMYSMFRNASSLTTLNLSTFNTRRVTDMSLMFSGASDLTSLDLSSFDTSNTNMNNMFFETDSLQELRLGRDFDFNTNAGLPEVPNNTEFTGAWQNVGGGTVENPIGEFIFTSAGLMANYDGSTMEDTFVWQPVNRTLTINNVPESANPMNQTLGGARTPGTEVIIVSGASSSYTFLGWVHGEDVPTSGNIDDVDNVITDEEHTFTMPTSNVTYTVLWGNEEGEIGLPNSHTLTINNVPESANPTNQTLGGARTPGTEVIIVSGASSSYTFLGWVHGEDVPTSGNIDDVDNVITDEEHTFTMPNGNVTYTALWGNEEGEIGVPNNVYIKYTFDWGLEGVPNRTGEVRYNTAPSLPTDIPVNPGYRFDGWNPVVGPITEDTTFEAIWTPIPVREPDLESDTKIDDEYERVTLSPSGPRLPQTGAIMGSSFLGGVALAATGVAVASKKRKDKK